jgi:alpha-maltose-1-phosphate synthase
MPPTIGNLNPAIRFAPEAFMLPNKGLKLMGRQAAGVGFLRAAVDNRTNEPLWAFSSDSGDAEIFKRLVREIDPGADARWVPADRSRELLPRIGVVYWPDPGIGRPAQTRLRAGSAAYSLCGVTHTTASHQAMDGICEMLTAPVMPWDALICTSTAVAETVTTLLESESDYLRWRFGSALNLTLPQRPVIPLGVHAEDFDFTAEERSCARRKLDVDEEEVVVLFLGRLAYHVKAHPYPMYVGLQHAARQTGKKIVLIQCGWFGHAEIESAVRDGAAQFCPDVRVMFTDGYDEEVRRECWASADIFISLADNIQETFGLTPIEAMAAGLPVVVTDWNGYKDTVRDGIDGFRIPTWMPPPGQGDDFAFRYESNSINYSTYCGVAAAHVSVDLEILAGRLTSLVAQEDLRQSMGKAGRRRAREVFDWAVVYRRYQALWAELSEIRQASATGEQYLAPRNAASRSDPYLSFGHYPSATILPTTLVYVGSQAGGTNSQIVTSHPLFGFRGIRGVGSIDEIFLAIQTEPQTVRQLADRTGVGVEVMLPGVARLAKMGFVQLRNPSSLVPTCT